MNAYSHKAGDTWQDLSHKITVIGHSLRQSLLIISARILDNVTFTLINILATFVSYFVILTSIY